MEKIEKKLINAFVGRVRKSRELMPVVELCKLADVSRASFYLRFKSIEDFYLHLHRYFIDKLIQISLSLLRAGMVDYSKLSLKKDLGIDEIDIKIFRCLLNYGDIALLYKYIDSDVKTELIKGLTEYKNIDISKLSEQDFNTYFYGFVSVLFYNIIDYDVKKFTFELTTSRNLVINLLKGI